MAAAKAGLNKAILDAGWAQFATILAAKAESAGRRVVFVNPAGTSIGCHQCGRRCTRPRQDTVICPIHGAMDADINGARNIAARAGLGSGQALRLEKPMPSGSEQSLGQLISRYQESGRGEASAPQRGEAQPVLGAYAGHGSHACLIRAVPARRWGSDLGQERRSPCVGCPFPSIVIALRGGQAPGQGRRIEGTMSHDKIRAAARRRMAETGEPYAAARRAVVSEHQAAGAGSRLRAGLRTPDVRRDPRLAGRPP